MPLSAHQVPIVLDYQRRRDANFVELAGGVFSAGVFVETDDTGEGIVQVGFPVVFLEEPLFTYGSKMQGNQALTFGAFPTLTATVYQWKIGYRRDNGARSWLGATLAVVVTGPAAITLSGGGVVTLGMILHGRFEGRAVRPEGA